MKVGDKLAINEKLAAEAVAYGISEEEIKSLQISTKMLQIEGEMAENGA